MAGSSTELRSDCVERWRAQPNHSLSGSLLQSTYSLLSGRMTYIGRLGTDAAFGVCQWLESSESNIRNLLLILSHEYLETIEHMPLQIRLQ